MDLTWSKHETIWNSILKGIIQIGENSKEERRFSTKSYSSNSKRYNRMNTLSFSQKFTSVNFIYEYNNEIM